MKGKAELNLILEQSRDAAWTAGASQELATCGHGFCFISPPERAAIIHPTDWLTHEEEGVNQGVGWFLPKRF